MIFRLFVLCFFIYLIYLIPSNFLNLDFFDIKKINIVGNSKMLQSELTMITKKIYNKKNIEVNYDLIKEKLEKDIRVENAEIRNNKLGEISINLNTKKLAYYAILNGNIYLVDKDGEAFGYLNEKKIESLPLLVIKNSAEIKELIKILSNIQNSGSGFFEYISQAYKVSENEYIIVLLDGVKIKINQKIEDKKYITAEMLYSEMKKNKEIDYIDLRFDDYIIKYLGDIK